MNRSKIAAAGIAVLAIVSLSGLAFAHGGFGGGGYYMGMGGGHMMGYEGYGNHLGDGPMMGYEGYDNHMGDGYGYRMGYGYYGRNQGLSDEQIEKLSRAREAFFNASSEIRDEIYQKRLDINRELSKEHPNADKLRVIQKDLSGLESELDQKRLAHELEIKKILPESGSGYSGQGYGRGFGGRHMD